MTFDLQKCRNIRISCYPAYMYSEAKIPAEEMAWTVLTSHQHCIMLMFWSISKLWILLHWNRTNVELSDLTRIHIEFPKAKEK